MRLINLLIMIEYNFNYLKRIANATNNYIRPWSYIKRLEFIDEEAWLNVISKLEFEYRVKSLLIYDQTLLRYPPFIWFQVHKIMKHLNHNPFAKLL